MSRMARRGHAKISVEPRDDLIDEPVVVNVSGLSSNQKVTVLAQIEDNNNRFASFAQYVADNSGSLDVATTPSVGGTYTGIEPMGLFWSMKQEEGQRQGLRLMKKDVTKPYDVTVSVMDGHLTWEYLNSGTLATLCKTNVYRRYMHPEVRKTDIREGNVRGVMFTQPGNKPSLGVIDFFGTAGGIMDFRAALLASRGFTTLSLPWFNYDDLPESFMEVNFRYFEEAADWFSRQPEVLPDGIGVIGVSKGGEFALLMGIHCPSVKAVVNIGGPVHLSFGDLKFRSDVLPGVALDYSTTEHTEDGISSRNSFLYEPHHVFPYDQMKARVLMLLGEDDQVVNPLHQQEIVSQLPPEHRSKFKVIVYPKTGHLIEPPHAPICTSSWHKGLSTMAVWGGDKRSHAHAQVLAWRELQQFLKQTLNAKAQSKL